MEMTMWCQRLGLATLLVLALNLAATEPLPQPPEPSPSLQATLDEVRVAQLFPATADYGWRRYANALPSLLRHVAEVANINVVPEPVAISDFADERLLECPFIYANFADRSDWTFSSAEVEQLRGYLDRGGFLYIDAGITASFLREHPELGQHHSYAEWDACPELKTAFAAVFPDAEFQ
ncbi:MAG: DUF4159 domain-containing protein, partial [Lentisphaerae bacterium]|nr:DUF4159 domain-containing protein [Lentisphaerota bacterium]